MATEAVDWRTFWSLMWYGPSPISRSTWLVLEFLDRVPFIRDMWIELRLGKWHSFDVPAEYRRDMVCYV